jgi:hypothetical protein
MNYQLRPSAAAPGHRILLAEYDEREELRLGSLNPGRRAAFAAACAERLFRTYDSYRSSVGSDTRRVVRQALDLAWQAARGADVDASTAQSAVDACVQLIPGQDDDFTVPAYVDDAIAAAAYAVAAAADLFPRAAAWAAQRGTDTLANYLLDTVVDHRSPDASEMVSGHPLVLVELERRAVDLQRLTSSNWRAEIDAMRLDATASTVLPLDQLAHDD